MPQDCVAGSDAQHQRAEARQEKTAGRRVFREAVSDAQHQQPEVAKKKRHEAVFFVKQARLHGTGSR
jgi:hypothetical protein